MDVSRGQQLFACLGDTSTNKRDADHLMLRTV
jgi:hypothetical protein